MGARKTISRHERFRRAAGLTVTELAQRIGVSHAYVSQIEGGASPSARYRQLVSKALGVPESWIFDEKVEA